MSFPAPLLIHFQPNSSRYGGAPGAPRTDLLCSGPYRKQRPDHDGSSGPVAPGSFGLCSLSQHNPLRCLTELQASCGTGSVIHETYPRPKSLPLTRMDPKPREEEESQSPGPRSGNALEREVSRGWRPGGGSNPPSHKDLTWNVHQEGGRSGALGLPHLQPRPRPPCCHLAAFISCGLCDFLRRFPTGD